MSKCPICFLGQPPDAASWICANRSCSAPRQNEPAAQAYLGHKHVVGQRRQVTRPRDHRGAWSPPAEQFCTACGQRMTRSCAHCMYPLPDDLPVSEVICVAFTGAIATGKSISIGVMWLFLETLVERLGSAVEFEARYSESSEEEYREFLKNGHTFPPTPPGRARSLLLSLGRIGSGPRRYLAIRDIAGEDMEAPEPSYNLSFLSRADLVVFLFDPLGVESIAHALDGLIPPQQSAGAPPEKVLKSVTRQIGTGRPRFAVCIAKVDTLQALAERPVPVGSVFANLGSALVRESGGLAGRSGSGLPGYDEADGDLLSEEVRSLLGLLDAHAFVNLVENPSSGHRLPHRYFATSALGESADGPSLHSHGITPFRILDPLLWILHEKGVIG